MEDDEITDADELTWNSDGIAWDAATRLDVADVLTGTFAHAAWTLIFLDDHFFALMVLVFSEGMEDAVSGALEATAERVVFALVVVVAHFAAAGVFDGDFFVVGLDVCGGSATLVLDVVGWVGAAAVVSLGDV